MTRAVATWSLANEKSLTQREIPLRKALFSITINVQSANQMAMTQVGSASECR